MVTLESHPLLGGGDPHLLPGAGAMTTTEKLALLGVGAQAITNHPLLGAGDQAHQAGEVHQAGQDPNLLPEAGTKLKYHQVIYLLLIIPAHNAVSNVQVISNNISVVTFLEYAPSYIATSGK